MALADEVQLRVKTQKLAELTNPNSPGTNTVDTTFLTTVSNDVEADFRIYGGVTFSVSDARHVSEAIIGVILKLNLYKGESAVKPEHQAWRDSLARMFRNVTGNNRIKPKTSSKLTPADEAPNSIEVRPEFDIEEHFDDLKPD